MEELRRRRVEREARESAREKEVLGGTRGGGGFGGQRRDDRARCYQDQFNLAFSRKYASNGGMLGTVPTLSRLDNL